MSGVKYIELLLYAVDVFKETLPFLDFYGSLSITLI